MWQHFAIAAVIATLLMGLLVSGCGETRDHSAFWSSQESSVKPGGS